MSFVQDHHNKINSTIKEVTQFFGFLVHIKESGGEGGGRGDREGEYM